MKLQDRIKLLRENSGMTQKLVGEKIGVSDVSVRCWESGAKAPSSSAIKALASLFSVSADFILGLQPGEKGVELLSTRERSMLSRFRLLDDYGKRAVESVCDVECSRVNYDREHTKMRLCMPFGEATNRFIPLYLLPSAAGSAVPEDNCEFELIPADEDVPSSADFAVRIQGDSMMPYIHDGDIVYVQKRHELSIGDVGIFCVDGAMYCKQYFIDDRQNMTLISTNELRKCANVFVSHDSGSAVQCYGRVILDRTPRIPEYFIP